MTGSGGAGPRGKWRRCGKRCETCATAVHTSPFPGAGPHPKTTPAPKGGSTCAKKVRHLRQKVGGSCVQRIPSGPSAHTTNAWVGNPPPHRPYFHFHFNPYTHLAQVTGSVGACPWGKWRRCMGLLAQVFGANGAGVEKGLRPAPPQCVQPHFPAQVPTQKPHLHQKDAAPAPKGCGTCAERMRHWHHRPIPSPPGPATPSAHPTCTSAGTYSVAEPFFSLVAPGLFTFRATSSGDMPKQRASWAMVVR